MTMRIALTVIGQSCTLWQGPLRAALLDGDAGPLLARAQTQLDAGADALDLNAGLGDGAASTALPADAVLAAAAMALRAAGIAAPLALDCGDPRVIERVLIALAMRNAAPAAYIANAIEVDAAGRPATSEAHALLAAAATRGAGIVISPRALLIDGADAGDATQERAAMCASHALAAAHAAGCTGPVYIDALAMPVTYDPAATAAVWSRVRGFATVAGVSPLLAVGNTTHGIDDPPRRAALRRLYAAIACGTGVRALIVPVEDRALMTMLRAFRSGSAPPDTEQQWLATAAEASAAGASLPEPPSVVRGQADPLHAMHAADALLRVRSP